MKLLLINNGYPTISNPKHASYLKSIHESLSKTGIETDLLVLDSNFKGKIQHLVHYLKFYFSILFFQGFGNYDFVYVNNYPFCFPLLFRFGKIKQLVVHWHGLDLLDERFFVKHLIRFSASMLPKNCRHITPSVYFASIVSRKLNIRQKDIFVSPSGGIDVDLFCTKKDDSGKDKNTIVLGFASALLKIKGIDLIISMLKKMDYIEKQCSKKILFCFLYYGKEKEQHSILLNKNKNVIQKEVIPSGEMYKFYQSIDILLFPTRGESLGLVGLEAMSCGVPVVGTDDFSLKEYIISGKTGERFKKDDVNDLINAVIRCIKNHEYYSTRQFIMENYSKESTVKNYAGYFSEINRK